MSLSFLLSLFIKLIKRILREIEHKQGKGRERVNRGSGAGSVLAEESPM